MSDALDDLLGENDSSDGDEGGNADNDKRVSDALHRKEKEADKLRKQVESLTAQVEKDAAERRSSSLVSAAKQLGIKDKHIGFYPSDASPEAEAVKQWAIDNEFIAPGSGEKTTEEKQEGFDSGGFGGNEDSGPAGVISSEEAFAIYQKDPQKALKLLKDGKVELDVDFDYGGAYRYPSS